MTTDEERAAFRQELRSLEEQIRRLGAEVQELGEDLRQPGEATAARMAVEQLLLLESLERRRGQLRVQLGEAAPTARGPAIDLDDNALNSFGDEPATFPKEGRSEEVDPAVLPGEWTAPRGDQLVEAVDVDDPVEALEVGALSAAIEDDPFADATELADRAAPPPPEEAALSGDVRTPSDVDHLEVGLPPGIDVDQLEDASLEDLIEAELAAIDEGDPETAAIISAEIDRRGRRE
ncbi:MAG: hypothetical protein JWM12_1579 [Ilumatobacteraceae bacterium]|nr:hypothetical protein [Ilumatobacteraceae bacterium]